MSKHILDALRHSHEFIAPLLVESRVAQDNLHNVRTVLGWIGIKVSDDDIVKNVLSQLDIIIRNLYSNPPKHGAGIVKVVLSDPALYQEWREELLAMSKRIQDMRKV